MIRDDFLLRQIAALAALVARVLGKRRSDEQAQAEAECAGRVGLDLDVAQRLPGPVLLDLLTTADGLDAERCLALGLGLALRARAAAERGDEALAARVTTSARLLLATAIARRPGLDGPGVQAVLAELAGEAM
jgi:hypothetical protein